MRTTAEIIQAMTKMANPANVVDPSKKYVAMKSMMDIKLRSIPSPPHSRFIRKNCPKLNIIMRAIGRAS